MIVVMEEGAPESQIEKVMAHLLEKGIKVHRSDGTTRTVLGVIGDASSLDKGLIETFDGVFEVVKVSEPFKLTNRKYKPEGTVVQIDDVRIGGDEVVVMAGPCSAENEQQVYSSA
ncbi:MAG: 3-deoxy-7-phosphoheptulonate synthase, partial [Acidobacteria bacterium]|nr:3-deoxy-7-phosphoheptulonate synthase [Acidobacteriota bacterium]